MPLLTSYADQDNFFRRRDPRIKLLWLVEMTVFAFSTGQIPLLMVVIGVVLTLSWAARLDLRVFVPATKVVGTLAVGVLLIQTIFHAAGPAAFRFGPVALYSSGFWLGITVMLRLYGVVLAFLQFLTWTHPTDLALAVVKVGLPYRYAMLFGLTLRFLPVVERELASIYEAQAARGLEIQGVWRRARALRPIMLPLCLRTLRRANEVALAMELRGYGFRRERTFLRQIGFQPADYAITLGLLLLVGFFAILNRS